MPNMDEVLQLRNADALPIPTQMSQVIQAGLPLESGLHALAEQTRSRRTRMALLTLSQCLERGEPLEDAVLKTESGLTRQMKTLIVAGLESGRLDSVMQYCVDQAQRAASLRTQMWLALSYPLFLFWFSSLICGFILFVVLPPLGMLFEDYATEAPAITKGLIGLSTFLSKVQWLPWMILVTGGISAGILLILAGLFGWGQRWATSIPLIGRVFHFASLMDFCQILSTLTASGLPFTRALKFTGEASDDAWLARRCQRMIRNMDEGDTAEEAALDADFPIALCQAFRGVSSTNTFAEGLLGLADIFAAQCQVTMTIVNGMLAQLAVFVVVGFSSAIGIVIFATVLHLLRMLS